MWVCLYFLFCSSNFSFFIFQNLQKSERGMWLWMWSYEKSDRQRVTQKRACGTKDLKKQTKQLFSFLGFVGKHFWKNYSFFVFFNRVFEIEFVWLFPPIMRDFCSWPWSKIRTFLFQFWIFLLKQWQRRSWCLNFGSFSLFSGWFSLFLRLLFLFV